jgi:hypothetical protein
MWLGFALLFGLLIFIIWDGRRLRAGGSPVPREMMKKGFAPRGLIHWQAWLGMGLIAGVLAVIEWQDPSGPPFTGRWSLLHEFAYTALGQRGAFALFAFYSAASTCYGLVLFQRSRKGGGGAG